jgi:protein ImuB
MLWLAIHLPALSLESFAATLPPEAQARPLALIDAHRITQVNARAAALGVQSGCKRATALALAADLLLGQADAARDAQALQAVVHAALAFTPSVCVDATAGVPVVLLEVHPSLRYFGGFAKLLQRLQAALRPLKHRVQIAAAPTPLGAALLARWRDDLARGAHATDCAALRRLLDEAPVWLLGPGREHWEALQGMGLTRLADLRHLPRSGLARRFGPELLVDLDRARGDAPDPREPIEPPPRFDQRLELFARADTAEQLLAGARVLLARLLAWAAARQGRIARFALVAHPESRRRGEAATPCMLEVALAEPSVELAHLQSLLAERLARWELPAPTLDLSLHCDALVHAPAPNAELFPSRNAEREGLVRLIERLQARLGPQGVQQLVPVADHRPERALAWVPAGAGPGARRHAAVRTEQTRAPLTRPLWLIEEPQPLVEQASRPCLDGAPLQLLAGPERIESGWWDGALAARDYFIASAADGALVWVFRARLPLGTTDGGGWFLQGRFA